MSVYVSYFAKGGSRPPSPDLFDDYLPFDPDRHPAEISVARHGSSQLIVWQWGAAIDRPIRIETDGALFVQGYGDTSHSTVEERVLEAFRNQAPVDDTYGGFSALLHRDDGVVGYSSLTGMDPIFVFESNEFVAMSNRIALLSALGTISVRHEALVSLCGRTHLQDHGTAYKEISRVGPGGSITVTGRGVVTTAGSLSHVADSFDLQESADYLTTAMDAFVHTIRNQRQPLQVSLSGGKDSRAVLALMDYANRFDDDVVVQTMGHSYDPEVLAAQDLMDLYGHPPEMHRIVKPTYVQDTADLAKSVTTTLFTWEGHMSLADSAQYTMKNDRLSLGGHELGMKYWGNRLGLEEHLKAPTFPVNVSGLLNPGAMAEALARYGSVLAPVLAGTPQPKYNIVEAWAFRNPNFAVHDFLRRNASEYEFHPFLDISFIKLLLSCPVEMTRNQLLHYLIMAKARVPVHTVPFAGDRWPSELLDSLRTMGRPLTGVRVLPYDFRDDFPDATGRGLYNRRIELLRLAQRMLRDTLDTRPAQFDFLDYDRVDELTRSEPETATVSGLYAGLGLLNAVLIAEYGPAFLKRTNGPDLARELEDRMGLSRSSPPRASDRAPFDRETAARYDQALVGLVRDNQALRYSNSKPIYDSLTKYERLGEHGLAISVEELELMRTLTISGRVVTSPTEVRNAVLITVRFDGQWCEVPGFTESGDPRIGWFKYLPRSDGTAKDFKIQVPVTSGVVLVEVEFRIWGATGAVHLGDLKISDPDGKSVTFTRKAAGITD